MSITANDHRRAAGAVQLFLAFSAVNASNFAFHMVTARVLTPASYGALGALLGLMLVLQVPIGALQVAITQQVAARRSAEPDAAGHLAIWSLLRTMTGVGLAAAVVLVVATPLLMSFFYLNSPVPGLLLAANMFPLFIGLIPRAIFLGEQRFRPVSVALLAGAITRLILGYVLGQEFQSVEAAIAATVIGDLVATAVLLWPLRKGRGDKSVLGTLNVRYKDATAAFVAFAGLLLLVGIDTVLARHFLTPFLSGQYAAAATAAHAALFISTALGLVAFPTFAARHGEGPEARNALFKALVAAVGLGFGAAALMALMPEAYITFLMGRRFAEAAHLVTPLAAAAAGLGVITVLVYFNLARYSARAWVPWLGVLTLVVAIVVSHDEPGDIAMATLVNTGVLTVVMLVLSWRPTAAEARHDLTHRPPLPVAEGTIDLTVVVPFYNPGPRFLPSMERLVEVLRAQDVSFEVIAVSDGSTDGSAEQLQQMNSDVVRSVVLERNWGKGEALRVGLSMGRGRYLGFIDADGDIEASIFKPFLALVKAYEPDIVLGSKRHPMSQVTYPFLRRIYSWGYQQFIWLLFQLEVRDTQTGVKLLRRDVVAAVLPYMVERGFAFDLELFVVARRLGYRRVFEAPVAIGERFGSTVSRKAVVAMFRDTFSIFYRGRVLRAYDVRPDQSSLQRPDDAVEVLPQES